MLIRASYVSDFVQYTDWARNPPDWRMIAFLIVIAALLAGSLLVYLIAAIRKPKVERKGTGMLGGFVHTFRPGGGLPPGSSPGAFALFGHEDENKKTPGEEEDPRRR